MKRHYSHRGNLNGVTKFENHPDQIDYALSLGYGVEIDVWKIGRTFYLGHDQPSFPVPRDYLINPDFLVHCKNVAALQDLFYDTNCFYHQNDDYTITSKGNIISYPGMDPIVKGILMKCEYFNYLGPYNTLCSDYIEHYKDQ